MTPENRLALAQQTATEVTSDARCARDERRRAVLDARAEGLTLAEIADILGVSYQRVWQIINADKESA